MILKAFFISPDELIMGAKLAKTWQSPHLLGHFYISMAPRRVSSLPGATSLFTVRQK
jgi:hypothetical protein